MLAVSSLSRCPPPFVLHRPSLRPLPKLGVRRPQSIWRDQIDQLLDSRPQFKDSVPSWIGTLVFAGSELLPRVTGWQPQIGLQDVYILLTWSLVGHAISFILKRKYEETETAIVGTAYIVVKYLGGIGAHIGLPEVVTGLFGAYQSLEMPGPAILWILSLLACMRSGRAFHWFVATYAVGAAWKEARALTDRTALVGPLVFLATAFYAYKQRLIAKLAVCILIGRIFASAVPRF